MPGSLSALFWRSFFQVSLVSLNVVQLARRQYVGAFLVGTAISYLWFKNARSAGRADAPGAAAIYALGAGCGTVAGLWISGCLT